MANLFESLEESSKLFLVYDFTACRKVSACYGAFYVLLLYHSQRTPRRFGTAIKFKCQILIPPSLDGSHFTTEIIFSPSGVQQGSLHGESKQSQSRKAIIRMLGKDTLRVISIYDVRTRANKIV